MLDLQDAGRDRDWHHCAADCRQIGCRHHWNETICGWAFDLAMVTDGRRS
jgi:hypothetical protein